MMSSTATGLRYKLTTALAGALHEMQYSRLFRS
jgi:urease accessory protein UreF